MSSKADSTAPDPRLAEPGSPNTPHTWFRTNSLIKIVAVFWVLVLVGVPTGMSFGYPIQDPSNLRPDGNNKFNAVAWLLVGFFTALAWGIVVLQGVFDNNGAGNQVLDSSRKTRFWFFAVLYLIIAVMTGATTYLDSALMTKVRNKPHHQDDIIQNTDIQSDAGTLFACTLVTTTLVIASCVGVYNFSRVGSALMVPAVAWGTYLTFVHAISHSASNVAESAVSIV